MINGLLIGYYIVFLLAVWGVGRAVRSVLKVKLDNRVEAGVLAIVFGTIVFSYLFHLLGAVSLLYGHLLVGAYTGVALAHLYYLVKVDRVLAQITTKKFWSVSKLKKPFTTKQLAVVIVLAFIFFPLLPYLFLYPASWDVLAYHLPLPKFYLAQHGLPFARWFDQTGFPIGIEAVFGYGEALHEPRVSHFIHFTYIAALAAYLLSGLKYLFSERARWLATFVFLFQPMLYSETALSAFNDYPLALFSLVTSVLVVKFWQQRKPLTLAALALMVGFLPLIKFSGVFVGVGAGLVVAPLFMQSLIKKKPMVDLRQFTIYHWLLYVTAALPPVLWFGRNYYFTGNPFYPFYNDIFKGLGYVPGGKELMQNDILQNSFVWQMLQNFRTSIDTPQDYVNLAAVGFVMLGMIAALWSLTAKKVELRVFALTNLITLACLLFSIGFLTRYIFFVFPALSLMMGGVLFDWTTVKRSWFWQLRWGQPMLAVLVILVTFMQIEGTFMMRERIYTNVPKRHWWHFFQHPTAQAIWFQQDNQRIHEYANSHLNPETDKVLQLLDNRIYYLDIPAEFANTIDGSYFTDKNTTTSAQVYQRIKNDGFTHAIKFDAWGPHPVMNAEVFNGFMNEYTTPLASQSGVTLYTIK